MPYIYVAAAAFIATYLCVPLTKRLAHRLGAIDYPSKRRINTKPIPRLGGLAMFVGLCVALIVEIAGIKILGWPPILIPHPSMSISYPILGLSFLVIVITGAVDDVHSLSPRSKLLGQILSACIAAAGGLLIGRVVNPFAPGTYIELGLIAYPITVIYLVAFTNIINLIDGLDGLAAGISGIASLSMFSFAVLSGRLDAAALSIALFGACLAFLRYNFYPASIWTGDHLTSQREPHRRAHLPHHPAHRGRRAHPRHALGDHPSQARPCEHRPGGHGPHPPPSHT
mgnify:CR=1 FL=1